MRCLVVRNTGSDYQVCAENGELFSCKIKGNFRLKNIKSTNPIAIGDWVIIDANNEGMSYITEIEDRRNYIVRRSSNLSKQSHIIASNLDQAFLITTINYPITSTTFIDRFLASAEAYSIPVQIVFNKIDRYKDSDMAKMKELIDLYQSIGYPCHTICARKNEGLEIIASLLKDKTSLLSGHSGVGKSTVINKLIPDLKLKTKDISEYHNKGMHTTTFSEMFALPDGGYIVDTPGIKGFGTFDMEGVEIAHYFREMFEISKTCKFNNCSHQREPQCAVKDAVENGQVSPSRYKSYLSMLKDKDEDKYREAY